MYNQAQFGWSLSFSTICLVCTVVQGILLPFVCIVVEMRANLRPAPLPLKQQLGGLWELFQKQAVWQPMLYIWFYNSLQAPVAPWNSFLVKVSSATPCSSWLYA